MGHPLRQSTSTKTGRNVSKVGTMLHVNKRQHYSGRGVHYNLYTFVFILLLCIYLIIITTF